MFTSEVSSPGSIPALTRAQSSLYFFDENKTQQIFRASVKRNWSQTVGECCVLAFLFVLQVQFGHAGASAHGENETAVAKNNVRFSFYELLNIKYCGRVFMKCSVI